MWFPKQVSWLMLANHFCNKFISPFGSSTGIFIGDECGGCDCLSPSSSWSGVQRRLTVGKGRTSKNGLFLFTRYICFTSAVKMTLKDGDETRRLIPLSCSTHVFYYMDQKYRIWDAENCRIYKKWWRKSFNEASPSTLGFISTGWCTPHVPERSIWVILETRNLHAMRLLCTPRF